MGGYTIFPKYRVIAYYGNGQSNALGVLGHFPPEVAAAKIAAVARQWATPQRPTIPAMELIVSVADGAPGSHGNYSHDTADSVIERYLAVVRKHHQLLVLDIQPGRQKFLPVVQRYEKFLAMPDVGVALDPEWRMGPTDIPGRVIGHVDAPEINAFATGMNRNSALVAVSTGLLRAMNRDEAEAVLGHEISHVANGDMVTMALIQGVLNTFVIFLARVVGRAVDSAISGGNGRDGGGIAYFLIVMALQVVFGLFASIISMWFSRWREFRADAGGARLAGRDKMINALQRLAQTYGESTLPQQIQAFGISGQVGSGIGRLFMSHPPLAERIAALRNAPVDQVTSTVVVR